MNINIFLLMLTFLIVVLGILSSVHNYKNVKSIDEGTGKMKEIAGYIRLGANTFLRLEYKKLIKVVMILIVIIALLNSVQGAFAFALGAVMSGMGGIFGMKMSTYANVRVTNTARETGKIGKALEVALRGGSVMGLSVMNFGILGALILFAIFGLDMSQFELTANWWGSEIVPFVTIYTSYALGCSTVALFARVGGGIYTKAADMGADLVGKTELNLPEDDPRNPAVIADCVGDNVGDTAGLGSDLLESFVGTFVSSISLTVQTFRSFHAMDLVFSEAVMKKLIVYPIAYVGFGLLACIISLFYVFNKKGESDSPHKTLNFATWLAAGLTAVFGLVLTLVLFFGEDFGDLPFRWGSISLWLASMSGILSGIAIGAVSEFYTSYDFKPTKEVRNATKQGSALTIIIGMAGAMNSVIAISIILAIAIVASFFFAGVIGVSMGAVGMLAFVAMTVSVDTYGPISDNAGGIAEMAHLDDSVRVITDALDAEGNTTAAVGKGIAIGSAAFTTISLMMTYLYTFTQPGVPVSMDAINPLILAGLIVGFALPFRFSGMLLESVGKTARQMVDKVREQFSKAHFSDDEDADIDESYYQDCISVATEGSISEMKRPATISIIVPVAIGLVGGPLCVAGVILGSTLSSIGLAVFCGNAGGSWDNAKKLVESQGLKGTPEHVASVVGDTVGDPLKDTVGPSLDINIKTMSVVASNAVSMFSRINLLGRFF